MGRGAQDVALRRRRVGVNGGDRRGAEPLAEGWDRRPPAGQDTDLLDETEGPKRQPLVFLTEGAVKCLREAYLPWRERFKHMLGQRSDRLFPCEELTIYRWLKEARERAGLPWLQPRLLRKFSAQWLLDCGVYPQTQTS